MPPVQLEPVDLSRKQDNELPNPPSSAEKQKTESKPKSTYSSCSTLVNNHSLSRRYYTLTQIQFRIEPSTSNKPMNEVPIRNIVFFLPLCCLTINKCIESCV